MEYKKIFDKWWDAFIHWMADTLPVVILSILICFLLIKFFKAALSKLKILLIKKFHDKSLIEQEENEKRVNTLISICRQAIVIILFAVFGTIILGKMGMNLGPILTSAGILGLAIGFGAQELVRDIISGFFILLENQIRTGDVAVINGTGGLVEKIELRTITVRDFSGVVHVFQNGKINSLSNMTKEWSAIVIDVGVSYSSDIDKVMEIMKNVGDGMQAEDEFRELFKEPIAVLGLDKFDDSALIIKARIQTKPISQWMIGREYRKRLKKAFDLNGIEIPFPQTTLTWGKNENPN